MIGKRIDSGGTLDDQPNLYEETLQYFVGSHLVVILPVPLLQKGDIISHRLEHSNKLHQLLCLYLGGNRPVTVLLGAKVDEIRSHAVLLTTSQLIHTKSLKKHNCLLFCLSYCGHMLVCHLVSDSPPHVHNLKYFMIYPSVNAVLVLT